MTSRDQASHSPFAFILYENRSGSTMLASLLHQRLGIDVVPENNFIPRVLYSPIKLDSAQNAFLLVQELFKEKQFHELGIDQSLFSDHFKGCGFPMGKVEFVERCLEIIRAEMGFAPGSHLIIKSPCYEAIGEIRKAWPKSKFIHIVRDGRAVFNSLRSNTSVYRPQPMNNNVVSAARSWMRKTSATVGVEHCITIRYESLIENEDATINSVLDFLGISESEWKIDPSKPSFHSLIGQSQKKLHINVGQELKPQRIHEWHETLSPSLIGAYDTIAGRALERLGYPRRKVTGMIEWLAVYFIIAKHLTLIPVRNGWILWETLVATKDLRYRISRRLRRLKHGK